VPLNLLARCLIPVLLGAAAASGQTPAAAPSAAELTRLYVAHAKSMSEEQRDFTFLFHAHSLKYVDGRLSRDTTGDYERIYIGGSPYGRLLARDGKPLSGKDLKRETQLYEQAVRAHAGLSPQDPNLQQIRDKEADTKKVFIDFQQTAHFVSDFRQEILGHETLDGHDCFILDLTPLRADGPVALRLHLRLSLESKTLDLMDLKGESLAPITAFSKGTAYELRQTYQDGVVVPLFYKLDTVIGLTDKSDGAHYISSADYTNYHRVTPASTPGKLPTDQSPPPQ